MSLYDPLTYENLLNGLVMHFEKQESIPLTDKNVESIGSGPGVYALFYFGSFKEYAPIAKVGGAIYVGQAGLGGRKGKKLDKSKPALRCRLKRHAISIAQASNLNQNHFKFRALPTEPVWINLAEEAMIRHYEPLWNSGLDGFGLHDPGKGRQGGMLSLWDTLHPGRKWAKNWPIQRKPGEAKKTVRDFFKRKGDATIS